MIPPWLYYAAHCATCAVAIALAAYGWVLR